MADFDLEILKKGYLAAKERGDNERAAIYGKALAERLGPSASTPSTPDEQPGLGASLVRGVDNILEGFGSTAEVFGAPETGSALKDAMQSEGPSATERFMAPDGALNFDWSQLPNAVAENLPDMAGVAGAAGAGAAAGSVVPGIGTVIGGLAGAGLYGLGRNTGDRAKARAANDGRTEVSPSDIAVGAGIGAVEGAIDRFGVTRGAGGLVSRVAKGATKEAATEAAQTGVEQVGTSAFTENGLSLDPKEITGSAVLGGATGGTFHGAREGTSAASRAARETAENIRTDDTSKVDEYDVLARDLLREGADYDEKRLGEVRHDKKGSAKAAADNALRVARGHVGPILNRLRTLAKDRNDTDAIETLEGAAKVIAHQRSDFTDLQADKLRASFGGEADVERLIAYGHASKRISDFTQGSKEDMSGLTKTTKDWDLTDRRNRSNPFTKLASAGALAGGLVHPAAAVIPVAGTVINRGARVVDNLTNHRSTIKRYFDTVNRAQTQNPNLRLPEMQGQTAWETLAALKASRRAEQDSNIDKVRAEARAQSKEGIASAQQSVKDVAARQRGINMGIHLQNTAALFNGAPLENTSAHQPYIRWQQATGLPPQKVLETLVQLEEQGTIPEGTAKRFRGDPRSFVTKKGNPASQETYTIQEAVRRTANPQYQNANVDFDDDAQIYGPNGPSVGPSKGAPGAAKTKFKEATSLPVTTSRRKQKAGEGDRRYKNLLSQIESDGSLSEAERLGLVELADEINTPLATADQRKQIVGQRMGEIVRGKAKKALWQTRFGYLASIGNDISIKRGDTSEQIAEEQEKANEKVKAKGRKKKRARTQSEDKGRPSAQRSLRLLEGPKEPLLLTDQRSAAAQEVADREPKPKEDLKLKGGNRNGLAEMVFNRVNQLTDATITATSEKADDLRNHVSTLPLSIEGRVEAMIYEFPHERMTINMLVDAFAEKYDTPIRAAVEAVVPVLNNWAANGLIEFEKQFQQDKLKVGGVKQRDNQGQDLEVRHIKVLDHEMTDRLETAKAIRMHRQMVDQSQLPQDYTPGQVKHGPHQAFKNYDKDRLEDGSNWDPALRLLNSLRRSPLSVSSRMLDQIEDGLRTSQGKKNLLQITDALRPVVPSFGKKGGKNKVQRDDSPMRTAAQLLHQLGLKDDRKSNLLLQEWMFGNNLRVYSKNGSASSQGGDLMKGILRAPSKMKLGDTKGVDWLFHSFGNLLGYDKESPLARRQALTNDPTTVDELLRFAENPFGSSTVYSNNSKSDRKPLADIIDDGEGFFQTLNVAHEVADMVKWARIRHPDLSKLGNAELLKHPRVYQDFANYDTDFLAQLDANNNAYQLVGLLMGDPSILQATGMQPQPGVEDPDATKGADIYMAPAKAIQARVPELARIADSKLRKLFKRPIGTYLYAAAYNSRRDAFADVLTEMAGDEGNIFGRDEGSLFQIAPEAASAVLSPTGHTFNAVRYSKGQETEESIQRRVVKKDGKKGPFWKIETKQKDGSWKSGFDRFANEDDALSHVFSHDLYVRMNRELVRDMQTRFPRVQEYLNFAQRVTQFLQDRGQTTIKVPTPDGMMLDYDLKEVDSYEGHPVTLANGETVNLGVKSGDVKHRGQGLAAFLAHSHDAYVLREAHRRLMESGGLSAFNPIHDSFGTHPSETQRLRDTVVGLMQELGDADYNIFLAVLEANGIDPQTFLDEGGSLPNREHVTPVDPSRIPTAVS